MDARRGGARRWGPPAWRFPPERAEPDGAARAPDAAPRHACLAEGNVFRGHDAGEDLEA